MKPEDPMLQTVTASESGGRSPWPSRLDDTARRHPRPDRLPIVYYLTNGAVADCPYDDPTPPPVLKIGTTIDLPSRIRTMQSQMPALRAWVIAWEPGGVEVESARHRQFQRYRLAGEWFWWVDDLDAWTYDLIRNGGELSPWE
jgi:hypothetical protein